MEAGHEHPFVVTHKPVELGNASAAACTPKEEQSQMEWMLASNGSSLHAVLPATAEFTYPYAFCGRKGLNRFRTANRQAEGKPSPPCRRCEQMTRKKTP